MDKDNKNKRGRPKKDSIMETIAVRLPDEIISEIDLYVLNLKKQFPMMNITRADAIRQLINNSLRRTNSDTTPNPQKLETDDIGNEIEEKKRKFWE